MMFYVTQQYMANVDVEELKQDEDALTHFIQSHVMPGSYRQFISYSFRRHLFKWFIFIKAKKVYNRLSMLYGCRQTASQRNMMRQ